MMHCKTKAYKRNDHEAFCIFFNTLSLLKHFCVFINEFCTRKNCLSDVDKL